MIEFINWVTVPVLGLLIGFGLVFSLSIIMLLLYVSKNFKD